jgi:hypothetical protein
MWAQASTETAVTSHRARRARILTRPAFQHERAASPSEPEDVRHLAYARRHDPPAQPEGGVMRHPRLGPADQGGMRRGVRMRHTMSGR